MERVLWMALWKRALGHLVELRCDHNLWSCYAPTTVRMTRARETLTVIILL